MNGKHTNWLAAVLITATLTTAGCKKAPVQNADGTVTNSNGSVTVPAPAVSGATAQTGTPAPAAPQQYAVRNPDGSITNPDGSVVFPAGSRVASKEANPNPPATNQPVYNYPASAPGGNIAAAPVRPSIVPAGTSFTVRTRETLSAHRNEVGESWTGSLARPIVYHGSTIFASGTTVGGTIIASKGKGRFKGAGALGIEVTSIGGQRVESSEYEAIAKGRGKRSAAFTGGGAGLGALIGGLAGGGKGALIGGLAGAGGGAAAGSYTGSTDVIIPAETAITFRLVSSLSR